MGKIGLAGIAILALILYFILVPWHNANDPQPANGERPGLLVTWWRLGQPTRPTEEQAVPASRPTAAPAEVATTVAPKPATNVASKAQGPKKTPTPKAAKQPQPNRSAEVQPQYINFAQAMREAAGR